MVPNVQQSQVAQPQVQATDPFADLQKKSENHKYITKLLKHQPHFSDFFSIRHDQRGPSSTTSIRPVRQHKRTHAQQSTSPTHQPSNYQQ